MVCLIFVQEVLENLGGRKKTRFKSFFANSYISYILTSFLIQTYSDVWSQTNVMGKFCATSTRLTSKHWTTKSFPGCFSLDSSGCLDTFINNIPVEIFTVFAEHDMIHVALPKYLVKVFILRLRNTFERDALYTNLTTRHAAVGLIGSSQTLAKIYSYKLYFNIYTP